jgi:hypothetical protein
VWPSYERVAAELEGGGRLGIVGRSAAGVDMLQRRGSEPAAAFAAVGENDHWPVVCTLDEGDSVGARHNRRR